MRFITTLLFSSLSLVIWAQPWSTQTTGFNDTLRGLQHIHVINPDIAWATAYDGSGNGQSVQEFARTVNGGNTWITGVVTGVPNQEPSMMHAYNADTAWIAFHHPDSSGGKIMRTNDGGLTWTHQSTALFIDSLEAYPNLIYFWGPEIGFAMGDPVNGYFEIYTTTNGGITWIPVPPSNMPPAMQGEWGYEGRFSVVGSKIWFGTNKGRLYKSNDLGNSWTVHNTPLYNVSAVRVVQFKDSLNGLIARRNNNSHELYSTSDGGSTWTPVNSTGPIYGTDLRYLPFTEGTLISTGDKPNYSGSSISHDFGLTWTDIPGSQGQAYGALGVSYLMTAWAGQLSNGPNQGGAAHIELLSRDAAALAMTHPAPPFCAAMMSLNMRYYNAGYGLLNDISAYCYINGAYAAYGSRNYHLFPGDSADLMLTGPYTFHRDSVYNIVFYTTLPNFMTDTLNHNDTLRLDSVIFRAPHDFLGPDTSIHAGNTLILDAGQGMQEYFWSTGDTTQTILIDSSGTGIGDRTIWAQVRDSLGCWGSDTIKVNFRYSVNLHSSGIGGSPRIYPNPAFDYFMLCEVDLERVSKVDVYTMSGILVKSVAPVRSGKIGVTELSRGMYIIVIQTGVGTFRSSLVIDR